MPHDDNAPTSDPGAGATQPRTAEELQAHQDIQQVLADFELGLESLRALHKQRSELQLRLIERESELIRRQEELRSMDADRQARDQELSGLRAERDRVREELSARVAQFEAAIGERESQIAALTAQAAQDRQDLATLAQDLKQARAAQESGSAESGTRVASLEKALDESRGQTAQLEQVLAELRDRFKAEMTKQKEELARAQAALKASEDRQTELTSKLAHAQAQAEGLRVSLERQASRAPAGRDQPFLQRRRERLKAYRTALRKASQRLKKGADALAKRFEQVEAASKQRAELAAIRDRVIAADRALQRARARGRAGVTVFCAAGTVAILGALSWAISRELAPATFVAESHLRADGRGRELNDAELQEWVRFHQDAIQDPRFHEAAAERFARVGRPDLGTAASVSEMITTRLRSDSISPGDLTLNLQERGREHSRRTLETFTAALASYANAAQQRRIDGGATVVPSPASVDAEPIDNTQTIYALAILGAGLTLAGALGLLVWRKLSHAKSAFEQDAQLAAVLDEARWAQAMKQ